MEKLTVNVHINFHKYSKITDEKYTQKIQFTKSETVENAIKLIKKSHIAFNVLSEKETKIVARLKLFLPDQENYQNNACPVPPYVSGAWLESDELLSDWVHEGMTVCLMDCRRVLVFRTEGCSHRNSVEVDESLSMKYLVFECMKTSLGIENLKPIDKNRKSDEQVESREYMFVRTRKSEKKGTIDVKLGFLESTAGDQEKTYSKLMKTDENTYWLHSDETLLEQKIDLDEELVLMRRYYGFQAKQFGGESEVSYGFFHNSDSPITRVVARHLGLIFFSGRSHDSRASRSPARCEAIFFMQAPPKSFFFFLFFSFLLLSLFSSFLSLFRAESLKHNRKYFENTQRFIIRTY